MARDDETEGRESLNAALYERSLCGCKNTCGDGDTDGPGTCKGLPRPKPQPLVEIVLVDRRGL